MGDKPVHPGKARQTTTSRETAGFLRGDSVLAELPEGFRWKVKRSGVPGRTCYYLLLQKKSWIFWLKCEGRFAGVDDIGYISAKLAKEAREYVEYKNLLGVHDIHKM